MLFLDLLNKSVFNRNYFQLEIPAGVLIIVLGQVFFQHYSGCDFSGLLTDGGVKNAPSLKSVTHILQ